MAAGHRLSALFVVALWTGLRRSALLALDWADVDLAAREALVRTSKSGRLHRVPLSDQAVDALRRWRLAQGTGGSGVVFTMPDGAPLRGQYATRLFDRLRQQAGLPTMTFHGLRHMAASLLLASGADIEFVSKVLDHSNVRVTSGIYSHLLPGAGQGHTNRAAALVPRKAG